MKSTREDRRKYLPDAKEFIDQPDADDTFVSLFMEIFDMWCELGYVPELSDNFAEAEIAFDEFLQENNLNTI